MEAVGATAIMDHTVVAQATVVAASPDMVAVVVAAPTVAAMAHKLLEAMEEAMEAVRNRLLQQLPQPRPNPPLLLPS